LKKKQSLVAVILAGGFGSRMGELTKSKHKTMLKIGGFPILAHLYTQLRINFVEKIILCVGYKSQNIINYKKKTIKKDSDKILKLIKNFNIFDYPEIVISKLPPNYSTSQRIFKIKDKIKDSDFLLLYGDTLLKPNILKSKKFLIKKKVGGILTLSKPQAKFGKVELKNNKIIRYYEKKSSNESWVNSGWCLIRGKFLDLFKDIKINFENYIFNGVIKKSTLLAIKNNNFYLPIDTEIELNLANKLWKKNKKLWF
jgi:glucose-1-phosphate cytidylyltransferase